MIYLISTNPDLNFWDNLCDLSYVINYFKDHTTVAVDTETNGLSFAFSKLWTIQFGDEKNQFVIDLTTLENKISLIKFIESKELIIHNAAFDIPFLYSLGVVDVKVYDTFLAEYVLTMGLFNPGRSLADVCKKYCNVELSKDQRSILTETGLSTHEDILYCALDVAYLHKVKEAQEKLIDKHKLANAVKIENEFVRVNAYIEYCGIYLNTDKWYNRVRLAEYLEYGALLKLKEAAVEYGVDPDINWSSSKQVGEVFTQLGIEIFDKKEGKNTVGAKFIKKQDHPIIKLYIDYKEKEKAVTTYGRNWFDYVQKDGRIHTKYKSMVDTARTSSGNVRQGPFPNMQNLSSDSDTRECFEGQKGNVLVIGDYSSQESIIMAEFSKEPALIEFFLTGGGDMHAYIAQQIYHKELKGLTLAEIKENYPKLRSAAKAAGFAIQYGGTGFTIADNMDITPDEGEEIYQNYMKAFPKLKEYFDKTFEDTLEQGYIKTNNVTNRKRFIDNIDKVKSMMKNKKFWLKYLEAKKTKSDFYYEVLPSVKKFGTARSAIYKLGLNTPIQSTAADMAKMAGVIFLNWIIKNKKFGSIKIVNFVHDEYVVECAARSAEKVAQALKESMEEAADCFTKVLKIKVEPMISKVWKK